MKAVAVIMTMILIMPVAYAMLDEALKKIKPKNKVE